MDDDARELEDAVAELARLDLEWRSVSHRYADMWKPSCEGVDRLVAREVMEHGYRLFGEREAAQSRVLELGRRVLARRRAA